MISVNRSDFRMEELPDECQDRSYLDEPEFEDRLEQFRQNEFYFVSIRASVDINIPHGRGTFITQRITSPGLWGIESDSGAEYFREVFDEEAEVLANMLAQLGVECR